MDRMGYGHTIVLICPTEGGHVFYSYTTTPRWGHSDPMGAKHRKGFTYKDDESWLSGQIQPATTARPSQVPILISGG